MLGRKGVRTQEVCERLRGVGIGSEWGLLHAVENGLHDSTLEIIFLIYGTRT